ncbi:hypothetical protein ACHAP5_000570 [Fusarium lateritium]
MEPETRATSFEKDAYKTKDKAPKSKTRSNSLFTYITIHDTMKEFRSFNPSRRGLNFTKLDLDYADEFYEKHFNELHVEIFALVQAAFCPETSPGKSPQAPSTSPWLRGYSEEFIKYVELVAHPDARAGKWERLLRDNAERSNLLQAIIIRVLYTKVFSQLLFGAGPKHHETLRQSDTALINAEGFERSKLRAHTTRTWLHVTNGEPTRFWEEVDKLCTQTLALLLPVYDYTSEFTGYSPVPVAELYQMLHDVIAYAGWISVCIRMSPAIVSINWLKPADPYAMGQTNTCQSAYEFSKEAALQHQMRAKRRNHNGDHILSAPRIKISVAPEIIRHKTLPNAMQSQGVTSYTILKPQVVYYEGLRLDKDEWRVYISLPDYIKKLRDQNCVPRYAALVIMLFVLLALWVHFTASGQQSWQGIQEMLRSGTSLEYFFKVY